jgi:hypothetical protein
VHPSVEGYQKIVAKLKVELASDAKSTDVPEDIDTVVKRQ